MSPRNETPIEHEERRERENSEAAREDIRRNDERVAEAHRRGIAPIAPLEEAFSYAAPRPPLSRVGVVTLRLLRRWVDSPAGESLEFNLSDARQHWIAGDLLDRGVAELVT